MAKKLNPAPFFVIGVILVLAVGGYFIFSTGGGQQNHFEFAECLRDEGVTMYGFDACPHCNRQKNLIGRKAFKQELDDRGFYVRCQPNSEAEKTLKEAGIAVDNISSVESLEPSDTQSDACSMNVGAGTPTFVIDGKKYVGEQSLNDLAEATGCNLPEDYQETGDVGGFTSPNATGEEEEE